MPTPSVTDPAAQEILRRCLFDWVFLEEADQIVRSTGGRPREEASDPRARTLAVLGDLLERGLIEAGDVTDGGFMPWNVSPKDAVERIKEKWIIVPPLEMTIGNVAWLQATQDGLAVAAELEADGR